MHPLLPADWARHHMRRKRRRVVARVEWFAGGGRTHGAGRGRRRDGHARGAPAREACCRAGIRGGQRDQRCVPWAQEMRASLRAAVMYTARTLAWVGGRCNSTVSYPRLRARSLGRSLGRSVVREYMQVRRRAHFQSAAARCGLVGHLLDASRSLAFDVVFVLRSFYQRAITPRPSSAPRPRRAARAPSRASRRASCRGHPGTWRAPGQSSTPARASAGKRASLDVSTESRTSSGARLACVRACVRVRVRVRTSHIATHARTPSKPC